MYWVKSINLGNSRDRIVDANFAEILLLHATWRSTSWTSGSMSIHVMNQQQPESAWIMWAFDHNITWQYLTLTTLSSSSSTAGLNICIRPSANALWLSSANGFPSPWYLCSFQPPFWNCGKQSVSGVSFVWCQSLSSSLIWWLRCRLRSRRLNFAQATFLDFKTAFEPGTWLFWACYDVMLVLAFRYDNTFSKSSLYIISTVYNNVTISLNWGKK